MLTKRKIFAGAVMALIALTQVAQAHVTIQPNEAPAGAFFRFVVRVPNERDVPTTKVRVEFPENLIFTSFQPKEGWTRKVKMKKLDEPIEAFGSQIDTVVDYVEWSGGSIAAGEFDEFGFSVRVPEEEGDLEFKAIQTYEGGEVVEWTGPEDGETPAPHVAVYDLTDLAEEGTGQLGLLHDTAHELEEIAASVDQLDAGMAGMDHEADDDGEEGDSNTGVVLGSVGIALGAIALAVSLFSKRSA
jgi:periplasmic copper chaperone A